MTWVDDVGRAFDGAKLSSPPDYTVKCISSAGRQPIFGVVQFVLPSPEAIFELRAVTCYRCDVVATHWRGVENRKHLSNVPTCAEHSQGPLRLVSDLKSWNAECSQLTVLAEGAAFLRELVDFVRQTNVVRPPWITFPKVDPFIGWNSAIEGSWVREVWAPYWQSLSVEQRAEVISRSPPPKAWGGWEQSLSWEFMSRGSTKP